MALSEEKVLNAKCICRVCNGTGVYNGVEGRKDIGVICYSCKGSGYTILEERNNMKLFKVGDSIATYSVIDDRIIGVDYIFTERGKKQGIKYVIYGTKNKSITSEYLDRHLADINIVLYEDYLNGKLPLPMMKQNCPKQFLRIYGSKVLFFDNNCMKYSDFIECENFDTLECWEKFYKGAQTFEEEQSILKKRLQP